MSAPDPHTDPDATPMPVDPGQVSTRPAVARIDLAARWVRFRKVELTATTTPVVLAFAVSPWWAAASGVSALLWAAHEHRARRGNGNKEQTR